MLLPEHASDHSDIPNPIRLSQFDRLAVIYNPGNLTAQKYAHYDALCRSVEHGIELSTYPSEPDVTGNLELLRANSFDDENCLWSVAGGDGTLSNVLGAAYLHRLRNPILVKPTGNANDIAHMLHSRRGFRQPLVELPSGRVQSLRPIRVTAVSASGDTSQQFAFAYFGLGISGIEAMAYNKKETRSVRAANGPILNRMSESVSVVRTLYGNSGFDITKATEGSTAEHVYEHLFVNGSNMANTVRFRTGLFSDTIGRVELRNNNIFSLLRQVGKAALGRYELISHRDGEFRFGIQTDDLFVVGQRDGETSIHESGTSFSVRSADKTINVITTR